MLENYPVKIDSSGRLVIPNKVRNMYNIKPGIKMLLSCDSDIIFFRVINMIDNIIEKLKEIECMYNDINFLLSDDKEVYYISKSLKKVDDKNTSYKHYYCDVKDDIYTELKLKVIYSNKKDESIAKVICELFSTL